MKRYRVILSEWAESQIRQQVLYIARESVDVALAWEDRLLDAIKSLGDGPGYAIDEDASARLGEPIRRYVFERNYLVHFRVNEVASRVEILNFRHAARLPLRGEP